MMSVFLVVSSVWGVFDYQDAFAYPDGSDASPAWLLESVAWEVNGSTLTHSGGDRTFAIFEASPHGLYITVEATVTVRERQDDEWNVAGVALRRDARDFWHIALVEAPEAQGRRHSVEVAEMLNGKWPAQGNLAAAAQEGSDFEWQYGRPYRLRLTLKQGRIEGSVAEMDGTQRANLAFLLDNTAVAAGQPALDCGGFNAAFDDVAVHIEQTAAAPEAGRESFPAYTVPGCAEITADATGFFYPKEINGRWWLIDPNGQAFYMVGADHISYQVHWCQKLGYAPYARNMEAKYGSEEKWADHVAGQLADWNFNTLPANHSRLLRHRQFPHIEFLSFGSRFAGIDDLCPQTTWTGFPNVFSPKWKRHCEIMAREQVAPLKDDPWLIGYFLDNELEWFGKNGAAWGLFDEAWKKPADHSAKKAWIAFLKEQLPGVAEFKEGWGVDAADFDALAVNTNPSAPLTDRARDITRLWTRRVADEYFSACTSAIRKYDPHHLILGSRFAGNAPDIWDIAGKYCDVVSFNIYPRIDVDGGVPLSVVETIQKWQRSANRPMMVTEWSFPALDTGLPSEHGAGMRVDTQAQRARCFTHFQTLMFTLPFMVGTDFFMWVDEPALGITDTFPEDSNYGLVNEKGEPYPELTEAARAINARVCELHANAFPPPSPKPRKLAQWLTEPPGNAEPQLGTPGLTLTSGDLKLDGPIGGHAWRLTKGDALVGDFYPLIHQELSQSLWVEPDTARVAAVYRSDRGTIVDMELARANPGQAITSVGQDNGTPAAQNDQPRRFLTGWRFWVPADGGWMAAQCLWIENTDTAPWKLAEVFSYLMPTLGGSPDGDEPLAGKVPNYYRRGAAWIDKTAGLAAGCWYNDEEAFECNYWKDPGGGFHPDLRARVDAVIQPGQRHALTSPPAFFFAFKNPTQAGFNNAISNIEKALLEILCK